MREGEVCSFPAGMPPRRYTHHLCSQPMAQSLFCQHTCLEGGWVIRLNS